MSLAIILTIAAVVALLLTTIEVVALWILRRRNRPFRQSLPEAAPTSASRQAGSTRTVSVLKPLCGLDDELEQNLASFVSCEGIDYEVILSVADARDPAIDVVRRVVAKHPGAPFRLVIGGGSGERLVNPKVERLIEAARVATGEILVVSDANVRVGASNLADTVALFDDPSVGCVSNLFVGEGADTLGARIESLHLLTFVAAGNALAALANVTCVVGKSMALTRKALQAIGGFEAFGRLLAEDQAIGLAVRQAEMRVVLSPVVVRNVVARRTIGRALGRQVRWNKLRWSFSRVMYATELLVNPLPLAILAAAAFSLSGSGASWALPALVAAARVAQASLLATATGVALGARDLALVPVQDLLQFGAQFAPVVSRKVRWKNHEILLGRDTEMIPVEA
jgi:ceramide glucosyltransferase